MTQIDNAIDALYAGPPARFVPARDALVADLRGQGDTDAAARVKGLRRPTAAAGLLNRLAGGTALAELARLGESSRAAQSTLDAAQLRRLGGERGTVTQRVLAEAEAVADEPMSAAVREQIAATVAAAIADPAAAEAVASGRLTKALSYSGFGEVDLSDAVVARFQGQGREQGQAQGQAEAEAHRAAPSATRRSPDARDRGREKAREKALAAAQERRDQAADALHSAQASLADATAKVTAAKEALAAADEQIARLRP